MQKQEIKSKRRSRELEGPASWREHRAMINHHDRRVARERQVNMSLILTTFKVSTSLCHSVVLGVLSTLSDMAFSLVTFLKRADEMNSFVHCLRSNESALTQRAFHPPLRTAPQRISHPAPPPQSCNYLY